MNKNLFKKRIAFLFSLFVGLFLMFLLIEMNINRLISLIFASFIGFNLYSIYLKNGSISKSKKKNSLEKVSEKRKQLYYSKGLSDEDIKFFRETMNHAKNQILKLEENIKQSGKLKAITNRHDSLNLIKMLFKDIVNEPDRLHEVDQFLYVHLPSLTELTSKYLQISQHEVKSKQTFEVLEKSAKTIDKMCKQISDDYLLFRSKDIKDLRNEVSLAKKRLNKEGKNIENDDI